MKRAIAIGLICCSIGQACPHPKKWAKKVHHALHVTGEIAVITAVTAIWILAQGSH